MFQQKCGGEIEIERERDIYIYRKPYHKVNHQNSMNTLQFPAASQKKGGIPGGYHNMYIYIWDYIGNH